MGRLVWFHVPLRLSPQAQAPAEAGSDRSKRPVGEMKKVMAEKKMALDIIEGCVCLRCTRVSDICIDMQWH
jgi:hypothetical protein